MTCKVINLYGGPGTGKSTTAAHLFALMKQAGINCELVTEYAKDKTWEESFNVLSNQLYVLAKQEHRLHRVSDKVDYIITDSPILLSLAYTDQPYLSDLIMELRKKYDNIDIMLRRVKAYNPVGRSQTEDEARQLDSNIEGILFDKLTKHQAIEANHNAANVILKNLGVTL